MYSTYIDHTIIQHTVHKYAKRRSAGKNIHCTCMYLVPETFFTKSIDPNSVTFSLPVGRLDKLTATVELSIPFSQAGMVAYLLISDSEKC